MASPYNSDNDTPNEVQPKKDKKDKKHKADSHSEKKDKKHKKDKEQDTVIVSQKSSDEKAESSSSSVKKEKKHKKEKKEKKPVVEDTEPDTEPESEQVNMNYTKIIKQLKDIQTEFKNHKKDSSPKKSKLLKPLMRIGGEQLNVMILMLETIQRIATDNKKDPHMPKKGSSAYIIYSNEQRASIKTKHADLTPQEITSKLADEWKKLTNEQKTIYEEKAEEDKARYTAEIAEYNA